MKTRLIFGGSGYKETETSEWRDRIVRLVRDATSISVMHVLPNLEVGGTQKVVLGLIDNIPEIKTSVTAIMNGGEYRSEFEQRCPTAVLENRTDDPHYSYLWFRPRPIFNLIKIIRQCKPNILQTHTFPAAVVGRTAGLLAGVPILVDTLHNTYYWKQPKDLRIDRTLAAVSDRIVCVSNAVKDYSINQNPHIPANKYEVIYNGIDTARYRYRGDREAMRARYGFTGDDLVIGTVGRLVKQKRTIDLIEAAPAIIGHFPNVRFLVAGDGPLADKLITAVTRRGISRFFIFTGTVHDTENVYPACDVFVQLADREGFGLTMVEAMASRTPVVAADAAPIQEIVHDGSNGIIFKVGDVAALTRVICTLFEDPDRRLRLGRQAERDIRSRFNVTQSAHAYRALYERLLAERGLAGKFG